MKGSKGFSQCPLLRRSKETRRGPRPLSQSFMVQGKQEGALVWVGRALARRTTIGNLLNGIFVNATVGNIEQARGHLACVRRMAPHLTLSSMRDDFAFRRPQDMAMWLEAFRVAGMPE
jgi:hypothetical protein